jgi:hypothetical protein
VGRGEFEQLGTFVSFDVWNDVNVIVVTSLTQDVPDPIDEDDLTQAGVVHFYQISSDQVDPTAIFTLFGDKDLGRFGSDVIVFKSPVDGTSSALVSAPYRSQNLTQDRESGRVFLYDSRSIEAQSANRTLGLDFASKTRFGSSMALVHSPPNGIQLLVGAQHYSPPTPSGLAVDRLVGLVGLYQLY